MPSLVFSSRTDRLANRELATYDKKSRTSDVSSKRLQLTRKIRGASVRTFRSETQGKVEKLLVEIELEISGTKWVTGR